MIDRIRGAGMIVGPAAFISAWVVSGVITEGYSPTRVQSGFWQRAGITTTDAWLITIGLLAVTASGRDRG